MSTVNAAERIAHWQDTLYHFHEHFPASNTTTRGVFGSVNPVDLAIDEGFT
jgi:hypothetical protein